jgi:hypothetical protein
MSFKSEIEAALLEMEGSLEAINAEISGSLQELESAVEQTITLVTGEELACVPTMETVGNQITVGPSVEQITCAVKVRFDLMDELELQPITGKTATFRGKTYRILSMQLDGTAAYYVLSLGSAR